MSFVLVRDRSRLGHKPDYRLGWSSEYVRKSMYACRSVSVACRPAEKRRRRGEIGSIHRSILVGHRRPNRRQRVKACNQAPNTFCCIHLSCISLYANHQSAKARTLYVHVQTFVHLVLLKSKSKMFFYPEKKNNLCEQMF